MVPLNQNYLQLLLPGRRTSVSSSVKTPMHEPTKARLRKPFENPSGFKWMFPKIRVPQNGWFILDSLIKMDDFGVPLFLETPKCFFPDDFVGGSRVSIRSMVVAHRKHKIGAIALKN